MRKIVTVSACPDSLLLYAMDSFITLLPILIIISVHVCKPGFFKCLGGELYRWSWSITAVIDLPAI